MGFGIFYMIVNIGSFSGKTVARPLRTSLGLEYSTGRTLPPIEHRLSHVLSGTPAAIAIARTLPSGRTITSTPAPTASMRANSLSAKLAGQLPSLPG